MTGPAASGTDRVAQAVRGLEADIVLNVQGDEPAMAPGNLAAVAAFLAREPSAPLATLALPASADDLANPNVVKVVCDLRGDILYMTRSPVPSNTRDRFHRRLKQVAIMPFRKRFLLDFQELAETPLEIDESVELLRAVEHGVRVKAIESPYESVSVDTEPDRLEAEAAMLRLVADEFYPRYAA
jgi:3-deoxy-manno-octulosonate cytidylyltransferase (CMP-KDO synthetase)